MGNIKKIRIQNFKSLEDVTIDFKPLTFLFGPNSSGKSSVLKALMFLANNFSLSEGSDAIFDLDENNKLMSYEETVIVNNLSKDISFTIFLEGNYKFITEKFLNVVLFNENNRTRFINEIKNNDINKYLFLKEEIIDTNLCKLSEYFNSIINQGFNEMFLNIPITENINYKSEIEIIFSNLDGVGYLKHIIIKENLLNGQLYVESIYRFNFDKEMNKWHIKRYYNIPQELYDKYLGISIDNVTLHYNNTIIDKINNHHLNNPFIIDDRIMHLRSLNEVLSEDNNKLTENNSYYNLNLLIYLFYDIIPNVLHRELTNYFHAPTIREIPKPKYILDEYKNFPLEEYYGFLNYWEEEIYYSLGQFNKIIIEEKTFEPNPENEFSPTYIRTVDTSNLFIMGKSLLRKIFLKKNENLNIPIIRTLKYLKMLGFNKVFFTEKDKKRNLGYVYLIDSKLKKSLLSNESSGIIQLLPIIIALQMMVEKSLEYHKYNRFFKKIYYLPDNICLYLFEQPELHLHPKLQSKLGDILADSIKRSNLISIITETHSEHLIRKLQILVAESNINKENIGVNYFYMENGITKVKKMEMDENGLFKEDWPEGFFDESVDLTLEHYKAIKNKKK